MTASQDILTVAGELTGIEPSKIENILVVIAGSNSGNAAPAYNMFWRRKADGGKRWILDPCTELKELQARIGANLLDRFPPSRFAHGWTGGRSPLTEARIHLSKNPVYGLSWDIERCFPSTRFPAVERVYQKLVTDFYEDDPLIEMPLLANVLALASTIRYLNKKEPVLPTGAPTSTRLINALLRKFDTKLYLAIAETRGDTGFVFTRYGDDLTVTSARLLNRIKLTKVVSDLLAVYGYQVNPRKVKVMQAGNSWPPLEVSGLILDVRHGRLLISDRRLQRLESQIAGYILLPKEDKRALSSLRAQIGLVVKVYGELPKRLANHFRQLFHDRSFHQDRAARARFFELTHKRRYEQLSYEIAGVECYADWVPHEVFDY